MNNSSFQPAPPRGPHQGPLPWPPRPNNLAGAADGFVLVWPKYRRLVSGQAVASMCLGILAAPFMFMELIATIIGSLIFTLTVASTAVLLSTGGLVVAIRSLRELKRQPDAFKGRGMALTGLIVSVSVLGFAAFLLLIAALTASV
ncbi:hypothetical protein [Haloglycomyces albus]|uniref:hypothetical protein n=1 Tax=Haloglycomyces albus TaxID=526067 RepID=UPI0012EC6E9D|nr:hypothetical protein [Haloglycomyces albus]